MAGELIIDDYQYEYNNLVVGVHTPFDIIKIDGLFEHTVRSSTVEAFGRHGDIPGRHYAQGKNVTFEGHYLPRDSSHFAQLRSELMRAFAPIPDQRSTRPLVYRHPGGQLVRVNARPTRVYTPVDRDFALGYPKWLVRFEVADPFAYSNFEQSVTITPPVAVSGTTFPLQFPLKLGEGTSGMANVRNAGSAPAPWTAVITGPARNPRLANERTGQELVLRDVSISANEVLVYDSYYGTVMLNGAIDRSGFLDIPEWWDFEPGDTTMRFLSDLSSELTSAVIRWRHTYWSE